MSPPAFMPACPRSPDPCLGLDTPAFSRRCGAHTCRRTAAKASEPRRHPANRRPVLRPRARRRRRRCRPRSPGSPRSSPPLPPPALARGAQRLGLAPGRSGRSWKQPSQPADPASHPSDRGAACSRTMLAALPPSPPLLLPRLPVVESPPRRRCRSGLLIRS